MASTEKKLEQKIKQREAKQKARPGISGRSVFAVLALKRKKRKKN